MIKTKDQENEYSPNRAVLVFRDNNVISFYDEVDSASVCEAIRCIDVVEANKKFTHVTFIINSGGGEIYNGLALYDRIRACKKPVIMIGTGFIASMAFVLFLAGDRRLCTKNARFLNHQSCMQISGRVTDIEIEQAEIKLIENLCIDIISERTLLTSKKLKHDTKLGDVYIGAEDALKMGIVHEIIEETTKERINV